MTTQKLLEELRKQLDSVRSAIELIEQFESSQHRKVKRDAILATISKPRHQYDVKRKMPIALKSYNGTHWMQKPENRAKMMRMVAKMKRGHRLALKKGRK